MFEGRERDRIRRLSRKDVWATHFEHTPQGQAAAAQGKAALDKAAYDYAFAKSRSSTLHTWTTRPDGGQAREHAVASVPIRMAPTHLVETRDDVLAIYDPAVLLRIIHQSINGNGLDGWRGMEGLCGDACDVGDELINRLCVRSRIPDELGKTVF
jgi:hypothetical protein